MGIAHLPIFHITIKHLRVTIHTLKLQGSVADIVFAGNELVDLALRLGARADLDVIHQDMG